MRHRLSMSAFLIVFVSVAFTTLVQAQVARFKVGYSSIGVGQSLVWVAKEAGLFKENEEDRKGLVLKLDADTSFAKLPGGRINLKDAETLRQGSLRTVHGHGAPARSSCGSLPSSKQ